MLGGARLCFEGPAVFLASQDSTGQPSVPESCTALENDRPVNCLQNEGYGSLPANKNELRSTTGKTVPGLAYSSNC